MTRSPLASLAAIALAAGLAALPACLPSAALANELVIPKAVLAIAHAATVRIETPGSPGSGVVIRNERDSCTLLSAYHVVASIQEQEAGDILFRGGPSLPLRRDMITRVNRTDLVILKLPASCPVSRVAVLANPNDVLIGDRVLWVAFPPMSALRFKRLPTGWLLDACSAFRSSWMAIPSPVTWIRFPA